MAKGEKEFGMNSAVDSTSAKNQIAPSTSEDVVASFRHVRKSHGKIQALDDLSFEIRRKEILCLLGPNGAGKSTAISLLLGLARQDSGSIQVFDERPGDLCVRAKIGCTPQETDFPEHLTVHEILKLVRSHYPNPREIESTLATFGLDSLRKRQTRALSGGQRRCLALACAFIGNPELVVLDEPTTGLDADVRRRLWTIVRAFAENGGSVVLTTHYLEEAETLATRVLLMKDGRVLREGDVPSIKSGLGLKRISFRSRAAIQIPVRGQIRSENGSYQVMTSEPDAFIRELVRLHDFQDLAIEPLRLEDAFLHLIDAPSAMERKLPS